MNETLKKIHGRIPLYSEPDVILKHLIAVRDQKDVPSRYLLEKLVGLGFVEKIVIKSEGRGRPSKKYQVSQNGIAFIEEESKSEETLE